CERNNNSTTKIITRQLRQHNKKVVSSCPCCRQKQKAMDKLRMQSTNGVQENIEKIQSLFPDCVTETIDERTGELVRKVDFEKLQQNLSDVIISGREERYQFTWPYKKKAILLANSPINAALRPCREESVDFDNTQNLYIEGDNLDVLKCLKETYLHKVKMIYIDPPYNTGNDFVYEDDFAESSAEYFANSGQFDEQGNRLVTNTESNGRFHTDWLNMIYPRLKVARDLLTDDGVIFISIGEKEFPNMAKVMDELFGIENRLAFFCWRTDGNFDNQARIKKCHEYILLYAKKEQNVLLPKAIDPNIDSSSKIFKAEIRNTIIKNGIKNPICDVTIPKGFPSDVENAVIEKDSLNWPQYSHNIEIENFKTKNEVIAKTGWASRAQLIEFIRKGFQPVIDTKGQSTTFVMTKNGAIETIKKRGEVSHVISVLNGMGGTQKATADMGELGNYFDYPKPVVLLKYLSKMYSAGNDIILDFFSGSATTAHAIMQLNLEDAGNRRFIMVQVQEPIEESSAAYVSGYKTICEIGKERIRRAGKKIKADSPLTTQDLDTGFRVLKLDSSNMEDVYYTPKDISQANLFSLVDNVKSDRTAEDLLFQVMLELGATLDSKIATEVVAGKTIYNVADCYIVACFDKDVTDEVVTTIAKMHPLYAVLRDTSMVNDSTATNFEQLFKTYSPDTVTKIL
ncbi:MAG: site-specific DNA-methyltransferase, partial [Prevotella sp.]|nr:site-specific DNA-methyltransferase [Prevotella sp.]